MEPSDRDLLIQWIIRMGDREGAISDLDEINVLRDRGLAEWKFPKQHYNYEIRYTDKAQEILKNGP